VAKISIVLILSLNLKRISELLSEFLAKRSETKLFNMKVCIHIHEFLSRLSKIVKKTVFLKEIYLHYNLIVIYH